MEVHDMAVVQEAFYIPNNIVKGLEMGTYKRYGGVVRYARGAKNGQIVKHLKPINLEKAEEARGVEILRLVKSNRGKIGIAVIVSVLISAGIFVYNKVRHDELKVVNEFQTALRAYIKAIREGNMDFEKINNLMDNLEELKNHKNHEKIRTQLSTEDLNVLMGYIYEYTIKLAKENNVEVPQDELNASCTRNIGTILNLQDYLKIQKRIFDEA
jgi:hypothetical protein